MLKKINSIFLVTASTIVLLSVGCKKGTFDINSPNPNVPSTVEPAFILPAAMTTTAVIVAGNPGGGSQSGNDLFNIYMGYWAVSGDYIPSAALLQYTLTTDFGSNIWESAMALVWTSSWAFLVKGKKTAIWSPSKSALKATVVSG